MHQDKLVSILTPAYNTGKIIHRLLDSVLAQTYPKIEMIVIDDGSTDDTARVIKTYIPRFKERGYSLSYVFQENGGQSVAINNGLKLIKGDYLCWPDSDDYYSSEKTIATLVDALESSDEKTSIARILPCYVSEKDLRCINRKSFTKKEYLFYDCLYARNGFWFQPGGYMLKTDLLDKLIPNREIFTSKDAGQNWQLLLPFLYQRKCRTINFHGQDILVRSNSHSRGMYQGIKEIDKHDAYFLTLYNTILNIIPIPEKEKKKIIATLEKKYLVNKLDICKRIGNRALYNELLSDYKNKYNHSKKKIWELTIYKILYRTKSLVNFAGRSVRHPSKLIKRLVKRRNKGN